MQGPYLLLAVVLFVLAVVVYLFRLPALTGATEKADQHKHTLGQALKHRHLFFGVGAIFFYVGGEVAIGSLMVNYLSLPKIGGITESQAAHYLSAYWFLAMVGRFAGSVLLARFSPNRLLALFAGINMLLLVTTMASSGNLAMYSLVAIGLFNSIMFPTHLRAQHRAPRPRLTNKGSSLLIMAIVGGALVPFLQGMLADRIRPAAVLRAAAAVLCLHRVLRPVRQPPVGAGPRGAGLDGGGRLSRGE